MKNEHIHDAFQEAINTLLDNLGLKAILIVGEIDGIKGLIIEMGGPLMSFDHARQVVLEAAVHMNISKPLRVTRKGPAA